jgi:pimeloyl-ACP methyl ester carboxylesterase
MSMNVVAGLAVEVTGEGTPVICIHGLGGTSNSFTPQMPVFATLRAIRPDLPCSGRSANTEKPSISGFAAAIARLADMLGVKSAHFIGHSLGTIICQHLAAERPELVRSLTLIGGLIEPAQPARDGLRQRAKAARSGGMLEIADAIVQNGMASDSHARNPATAAFVRESIMRQCPEGYARSCEALAEANAAHHQRIHCPTIIINGEDDAVAPPSVARELAERITGARAIILPRCGHWATVERPEEINVELRRFLGGQTTADRSYLSHRERSAQRAG